MKFIFKNKCINKLTTNELNKLFLLINKKFLKFNLENYINENIKNEIFLFINKVCTEILIIYDENEKIIGFIPYLEINRFKYLNKKSFSNFNKKYINLFKFLKYIFNLINVISYELLKNKEKICLFISLFINKNILQIYQNLIKNKRILFKNDHIYQITIENKKINNNFLNKKLIFQQTINLDEKRKFNFSLFDLNKKYCKNKKNNIFVFGDKINIDKIAINHYPNTNKNTKTIFLIHGIASNKQTWNELVKKLNLDYEIYTIDLPLHGKNNNKEFQKQNWNIFKYSILIAEIIKKINPQQAIIWGHSMGGAIATCSSKILNDHKIKIILESPYINLNEKLSHLFYLSFQTYFANRKKHKKICTKTFKDFSNQIKQNYEPISKNKIEFFVSLFSHRIMEFVDSCYKTNNCKGIVIIGKDDFIINCNLSKKYFKKIKDNYQFNELKKCYHSPHFYQLNKTYLLAKKFIDEN